MKVLLISGNSGLNSYTVATLKIIAEQLLKSKFSVQIWDLAESPLPALKPEFYGRHNEHPDKIVNDFANSVEISAGVFLATPLYHGSYSGILKNALDNLEGNAFTSKPVGLISHSGNIRTSIFAAEYLRPVVRSLGGYALNTQIGTTDSDFEKENEVIKLVNTEIHKRINDLVYEMKNLLLMKKES